MDINNNTNISSQIASSISKLNLNSAKSAFIPQENTSNTNIQEEIKREDITLMNTNTPKNSVDVEDIQKYANYMGENLSIDDINYGLMYGRSVIADYSV